MYVHEVSPQKQNASRHATTTTRVAKTGSTKRDDRCRQDKTAQNVTTTTKTNLCGRHAGSLTRVATAVVGRSKKTTRGRACIHTYGTHQMAVDERNEVFITEVLRSHAEKGWCHVLMFCGLPALTARVPPRRNTNLHSLAPPGACGGGSAQKFTLHVAASHLWARLAVHAEHQPPLEGVLAAVPVRLVERLHDANLRGAAATAAAAASSSSAVRAFEKKSASACLYMDG